jgi:hypothetical protein
MQQLPALLDPIPILSVNDLLAVMNDNCRPAAAAFAFASSSLLLLACSALHWLRALLYLVVI